MTASRFTKLIVYFCKVKFHNLNKKLIIVKRRRKFTIHWLIVNKNFASTQCQLQKTHNNYSKQISMTHHQMKMGRHKCYEITTMYWLLFYCIYVCLISPHKRLCYIMLIQNNSCKFPAPDDVYLQSVH